MSLVGWSRGSIHVAGLLGSLGSGVHGHGDVRLGERRARRWCRRRSWRPGDLTLELATFSSLPSGVAFARKSSTPASAAIAAAVSGLSPVTMMVLMPILQVGELLLNAGLDDVLEVHNAQHAAVLGHDQRGAAGLGDAFDGLVALLGEHAAGCLHIVRTESAAPLRISLPS